MSCLILAPATEEEINSGITDDQRFLQGIYAYANRNASPQMREHANKAFTHIPQYSTPKQEAYWMGATACAQFGTYDIKHAYTALGRPIPEGKTSRQLTEELGQYLLSDATSKYQEQDRIIKEKNAKITKHIAGLTNGTLKSSDISLEDSEDIRTATGLSAHDLYAAARIAEIKSRTLSDLNGNSFDTALPYLKDLIDPTTKLDALADLTRGKLGKALSTAFPRTKKALRPQVQQWGNQEKQIAQWLETVEDRAGVSNYASYIAGEKTSKRLANQNAVGELLHTVDEVGYSLYRGTQQIADIGINGKQDAFNAAHNAERDFIKSTLGKEAADAYAAQTSPYYDVNQTVLPREETKEQKERRERWEGRQEAKYQRELQASATAASIDSAIADAKAKADTSIVTRGIQSFIELAPFFNTFTVIPTVADMIRQNKGMYYANVRDDITGSVDTSYSPEILAKSTFEGVLSYASRAVPLKWGGKIVQAGFNKVANKIPGKIAGVIKNTVTAYGVHTASTAVQFGVIVPAEEIAGQSLYETITNASPELRVAYKNYVDLANNLKKPDYWGTQLTLGAILGVIPVRQYFRANKDIEKEARVNGLSKPEYNKVRLSNTLDKTPQAVRDAINEKAKNDPAQLIKDGTENTKQYLSEEQQHAQQELGHSITLDEAKMASLRQNGYDITLKPDNPDVVLVSAGGHIDPDTNKFVPGSKVVEVPRKTAELYFGAIYDHKLRNLTSIIRNAFGKKTLIEDLQNTLTGQVRITRLLNPFSLNKVIETGNKARAARDKKAKQIHEQSKQEDGTHTISIEEATAQADNTIDTTLHKNAPLKDLIRFGENAATRRQQELEKDASIDPDASFMSHAFVLSLGSPLTPQSLTRILHITENASAREVTEEYAEQWLKDYMFQTGTDITDAWRTLQEVNKRIKDHGISLTSINSTHPELADRLNNDLTSDGNITQAELDLIHSDVLEGFSSLILSDLRASIVNADGTMPAWADELYNSSMLTGNLMINELVAAAALAEARTIGKLNEAAKRLLNVTSEQIKSVLNKTKAPTKDTYWDAYQEQKEAYRKLLEESDYHKPEQTDSWLREHAAAAEQLQAEIEEKEREQAEPITEAIQELESLPENKDKPRQQIVDEVNKRCLDAQKNQILKEATVDDPASSIGKSAIRYVDGGIACHFTTVRIADLTLMPNFKSGADTDTGVVSPLVGDYNPAHTPINILRRTNGTLMVISGRHRLNHAKLHGATEIVAYIFDETPQQNLAWARRKDIEWNIQDNQATPLDIALLIRGELVEGMQPLTPNEYLTIGMVDKTTGKPRNGSLAELGFNLGTKASTEVINALRNDQISTTAAVAIAISSADPSVQQKGLQAAMDGMSSRDIPTYMSIQQSKIDALKNQGDIFQTDFFGTLQTDTPYSRFVDSYAMKQAKAINAIISGRKKAKQISTSKDAATILDNSGLQIDPNADPATVKANIRADQEKLTKWQSPYLHMDELRDQINKAFAKEHPEEWAKMQERQAQQEGKLMDAVDEALSVQPSDININWSLRALHASGSYFLKFDTAFMGTGEGAQAYGWGLYFAENSAINKFYFDQFNKEHTTLNHKIGDIESSQEDFITTLQKIFSKNVTKNVTPQQLTKAIYTLMSGRFVSGWNIDNEINMLQKRVDAGKTQYEPLLNSLKEIKEAGIAVDIQREFATNYRVELNCSKDDLLSWDDVVPSDLADKAQALYAKEVGEQKAFNFFSYSKGNQTLTGQMLYERILVPACGTPKAASMWLLEQGYKGIKHLDATSRKGKKNPTHNFIIFHNKDIKITAINRTGKWSMTEGWEPYTDPTADFSVFSGTDTLQEWQIDPTAGLGSLGHFADQINKKFAPIMHDETDKRYASIQAMLKRRQLEIQNMHGTNDIDMLLAEINNIPQIVNILPQRYRFSLEPYIEFLTTYADLIKNADPDKAGKALPMTGWDKRMANSFRKMYNRILNEEMTGLEQMEFAEIFSPFIALTDIQRYRDVLQEAAETAGLIFDTQHAAELIDPAKKAELAKLRKQAIDDAQYKAEQENADVRDAIYKAIGQMRANRLVEKMLARVNLKLEQFRKDRTLAKISRALASITQRKQKNGKPVKGTVSQETYNTALNAYRLLLLTKSQKEAVEEAYPDLDSKPDDHSIKVNTFDENGNDLTLNVTKLEFETYACLEGMTADQADSTAQTIGTLIATGKQAWQLVADQQKQLIDDFCNPIYEANKETSSQRFLREVEEANKIFAGKGATKGIKRMFAGIYNDAHLIDVIAEAPGLKHLKNLQNSIADAHAYLQSADVENGKMVINTVLSILGFDDVKDISKLSGKQRKALGNFFNEINDIKKLPKDAANAIILKKQAPDFYKKHTAELRKQLLKHFSSYRRTKNYSPNALAKVLEHLKEEQLLPEDIEKEVLAKYGKEGNSVLYTGDLDSAMDKVLPAERFGHLRNLLDTIETRTEESLKKWEEENKNATPETLTHLTRNVAAYRVLLCEQPDLADALYKQGYTEEVVQKLRDFAGEDMMRLAYAMRDLLGARMPILKEIYETTYGTPFPTVENYFRAFFNSSQKETTNAQINELGFGAEAERGGGMKIFHNRVKHNATIDETMSVTLAFNIGMREQNNVIAYTDPKTHRHLGEFLNRVLHSQNADTNMARALRAAIGDEYFDALKTQVENMHRIYGHARAFEAALNKGFRNISGAAAYTMLVYNWGSIAKNAMAYFNTLGGNDEIGPLQWAASAARVRFGQGRITPEEIGKESFIADRYAGWDNDTYLDVIYQQAGVKNYTSTATTIAKRGMSLYGKLDRGFCAESAAIMYDAYYRHLEKTQPDLPHDIKHVESLKAAKEALALRSQPMDWKQRPLTSSYNSWKSMTYFFLGGESWNALGNVCRLISKSGFRNPKARRALANAAAVWLTNGFLFSVINLALNFVLDDEEHWRKRNLWSSLGIGTAMGPFTGLPVVSNLASAIFHYVDSDYYVPTPSHMPMADLSYMINDFVKAFKSESSGWDKAIAASRTLQNLIFWTLVGTARPTTKAGAAIQGGALVAGAANNAINYLLRIGRATDERFITPVPEKFPKNVRVPKYLRTANKKLREKNANDLFGLL